MENIYTYYQISTEMLINGNSRKKDDVMEFASDMQEKNAELENKAEMQEINESKAKQMHQLWGDNFISDSLH